MWRQKFVMSEALWETIAGDTAGKKVQRSMCDGQRAKGQRYRR